MSGPGGQSVLLAFFFELVLKIQYVLVDSRGVLRHRKGVMWQVSIHQTM